MRSALGTDALRTNALHTFAVVLCLEIKDLPLALANTMQMIFLNVVKYTTHRLYTKICSERKRATQSPSFISLLDKTHFEKDSSF